MLGSLFPFKMVIFRRARSSTRFCRRSGASCGAWWPRPGHGLRRSVATPNRPRGWWNRTWTRTETSGKMAKNGETMAKNGEKWWKMAKNGEKWQKLVKQLVKIGENWWKLVNNWWKLVKKWWTHGENQREQWDFRWNLIVIHIFIVYFDGFWSTYIDLIWILNGFMWMIHGSTTNL